MSKIIMTENATNPSTPASGKRTLFPKSDGWYQENSSGVVTKVSGATNVDDLLDVDASTPQDGDVLVYNATSGKFESGNKVATVFGCSFKEGARNELDSNSSATFEEYLRISSAQCSVGKKFRLGVFVVWAMSSNSIDYEADVYVQEAGQSTVRVGSLRQEAQDAGQDQKIASCGFFYYTPTVSDTLDVYIEYRSEDGSGTAYTWYAGLEWWRVEL